MCESLSSISFLTTDLVVMKLKKTLLHHFVRSCIKDRGLQNSISSDQMNDMACVFAACLGNVNRFVVNVTVMLCVVH